MTKISPTILDADFANLGKIIEELEAAGADSLHLDVMDGHFVRNISFGFPIIKAVRNHTKLPLKMHLMIEHPDQYIDEFKEAGADELIIHYESECDIPKTIQTIKASGMKVGMAINPKTKLEEVQNFIPELDTFLIMSINPGWGGQKFMPEVLEKIRETRKYISENGLQTIISVDGGINPDTGKQAREAGADELASGSYIINSNDMKTAIEALRKV